MNALKLLLRRDAGEKLIIRLCTPSIGEYPGVFGGSYE